MKPKYIPSYNEEPRKEDKDAIAKALLTFSDEPLHVTAISDLTDLPKEAVYSLVWRMAQTKTKWPNIRRVADGTYMWDTSLRTRKHPKAKAHRIKRAVAPKVVPVAVEEKPVVTPAPSTWEFVGEVDGKRILKHADGTLWIASRLEV